MVGDRKVIEGLVEVNPYGDWTDCDRGTYVGGNRVAAPGGSPFDEFKGRHIRITIEEIDPPDTDE